jgi:uncharacterized membrane protein YfcA
LEIVDLTITSIAIIMIAVFGASIISSVTGMAGGVLMFAAMNLFIPLRPLIAIHGTVQIFNNAARGWFLRDAIRWSMCIPFGLGAIIGATLTTLLIARYVSDILPLVLLALLIFYTLLKPERLPHIRLSDRNYFWVGILTGCMGILVGAIDPLLAVFFLREDLSKEEVVANKSTMQLMCHLTKVPAFIFLGFAFSEHLGLIACFTVAAIVGTRLGVYLLARIETRYFFLLMKIALWAAGLRVTYQLYQQIATAL